MRIAGEAPSLGHWPHRGTPPFRREVWQHDAAPSWKIGTSRRALKQYPESIAGLYGCSHRALGTPRTRSIVRTTTALSPELLLGGWLAVLVAAPPGRRA